ncbi:hypothetical protein D3C76_913080 [compost metagenome]
MFSTILCFKSNADQICKTFCCRSLRYYNINVAYFSKVHRVNNVDVIAEVAGQYAFNDVASKRLSIYFGKIASIIHNDFFDRLIVKLRCESTKFFTKLKVWLQFIHHAWCDRWHINRIFKRFVAQDVQYLLGYIDRYVLLSFNSGSTQMRCNDDFWIVQEWMIRFRRFLLKHVERRASNDALVNSFNKSHFIDNAATSTVNDTHTFFHNLELRTRNHMFSFRCQRCMHCNEVCIAYDVINSCYLHTNFLSTFFSQEWIIAKDFHAKSFSPFGNLATDTSHTEYAQSFVAKLNAKEFTIPGTLDCFSVGLRNMTSQSHHHSECMLTSSNSIAVWSIDYDNPAFCSCFKVDVINPNASTPDNTKLLASFHDFFRNFSLAANKQTIVLSNDLYKLIFTKARLFLYYDVTCVNQLLNPHVTDWVRY